jgi:hypothetical protein
MLKFIGKALAGMVLTKEAREVAGPLAQHAVRQATQKIIPGVVKPPEAQTPPEGGVVPVADFQAQAAAVAKIDRAALIRQAMEVRAAQQVVLAELSEEERSRLTATAMRAFLNESKS